MARSGSARKSGAFALAALVSALATASIDSQTGPRAGSEGASLVAVPLTRVVAVPSEEEAPTQAARVVAAVGTPARSELFATGQPSVDLIPPVALAAYQRAAIVMSTADPPCGLDWALLAAIGRVESDHGRLGGNRLDASGVSRPGVLGPRLTGKLRLSRVLDTDGGELDHDARFDRAVGPMQFIPSTWAMVVVDGDGDGIRNPQDIDDAALAAAVFLCAGTDDLLTVQGERAAVHRYNRSWAYVDLVLAVKRAYESGFGTTTGPMGAVMTLPALQLIDVPADVSSALTSMPASWPVQLPQALLPIEPDAPPQPTPTEPAPTEPAPTEPAPTEPVATEPVATEPAPTEPAPTEPAPTEPAPTEPAPTEPVATEPVATEPAPTEPIPTEPAPTSEPNAGLEEVLAAERDACVAGGVDISDLAAIASCMAAGLVLVIGEDGAIAEAYPAEASEVEDPVREAAEVAALGVWLSR